MTRVNSQVSPFETASVERSEPTVTTTIAALPASLGPVAEGAQERERLEIDADELDAGLLASGHITVDEVPVGDDEQHAMGPCTLFVDGLPEDLVIEDGLFERDRQRLLGAKANGVLELLRVGDATDLERPDADAIACDAESHALLRKLVVLEEPLQCLGERFGLAKLAADDDSGIERLLCDLDELGGAVVHDSRG